MLAIICSFREVAMTKKDGRRKVEENEKGRKKADSSFFMDLLTPSGSVFDVRMSAKRELGRSIESQDSSKVRSKDYNSPRVSRTAVQASLAESKNLPIRKSKQEKYKINDTQEKVTQIPCLTLERGAAWVKKKSEITKKKSEITQKKTSDGAGFVLTPRLK
jgi:hypothetical protein